MLCSKWEGILGKCNVPVEFAVALHRFEELVQRFRHPSCLILPRPKINADKIKNTMKNVPVAQIKVPFAVSQLLIVFEGWKLYCWHALMKPIMQITICAMLV